MNRKGIFLLVLVFLVFIGISAVSANENTTDVVTAEDGGQDVLEKSNDKKAVIHANDYSSYYGSGKKITVKVNDNHGKPLKNVRVAIVFNTGTHGFKHTDRNGKVYFNVKQNAGYHKANIYLKDSFYVCDDVDIGVKVTKAPVKLSVSKIKSKTNKYTTLKAVVKNKKGSKVTQGIVKFKINGKTYSAKVKKGVAAKKIKLKKAKTYTYKAVFSAKNYKSKSASSKVIVKKHIKRYYYKKGGYSFGVSKKQQRKILYVKKHQHSRSLSTYANFKVKTGQHYYGMPVYAVVTTWSGIQYGRYYHYPQVQFVVMYGKNTWDWDYLTVHYKI